jgi:hypothetical protein
VRHAEERWKGLGHEVNARVDLSLFEGCRADPATRAIVQRPAYDAGSAKRPFLVEHGINARSGQHEFGIVGPWKVFDVALERLMEAWEDFCENPDRARISVLEWRFIEANRPGAELIVRYQSDHNNVEMGMWDAPIGSRQSFTRYSYTYKHKLSNFIGSVTHQTYGPQVAKDQPTSMSSMTSQECGGWVKCRQ